MAAQDFHLYHEATKEARYNSSLIRVMLPKGMPIASTGPRHEMCNLGLAPTHNLKLIIMITAALWIVAWARPYTCCRPTWVLRAHRGHDQGAPGACLSVEPVC